jgi:hypothetical protein
MSETFTVRVTVPDGYTEQNDVPTVEEMIASAVAELNGDQLADHYDGDDYDASIDSATWQG